MQKRYNYTHLVSQNVKISLLAQFLICENCFAVEKIKIMTVQSENNCL